PLFPYTTLFRSTLVAIPKQPAKALSELRAHFSARNQILLLEGELSRAQANLLQKVESFLLQVSDFLPARLLGKQEAFRILKQTLDRKSTRLNSSKLLHDTFLDFSLSESHLECHRGHFRVDD